MFRRLGPVWLLTLLAPATALALVETPDDPRVLEPPPAEIRADVVAAPHSFLLRYGGTWRFSVDPRTGRAAIASGSGIPVIPGRGNSLGAEALAGLALEDGEITLRSLMPRIEAFLDANRTLLVPAAGRLALDENSSGSRDRGRLWTFNFDWTIDDVPVEGATVFVRLNSGNITQFGAPFVGRTAVDTVPAVPPATALETLLAWSGDDEVARIADGPRLLIQPEGDASSALTYRLVWVVRYTIPGAIETWEGRVDARTGEVVSFRDTNAYGRVRGGVYPRTVIDEEVSVPFPLTRVVHGGNLTTSNAGFFAYGGGDASSGLDGQYFDTNCEDGCVDPAQPAVSVSLGVGWLDFGLGGVDEVGNGLSSRADRNAYFHLNQVRRIGKKWLPAVGWIDNTIAANVNISNTCNAVYNGAVNFYRSGNGCNNTGEISDVMQHEWGHGLDGNTRGGDGATGEATADVVAIHMSHGPQIGPYFRTDGSPVRNLDKDATSKGLLTRSNVNAKCPGGSGPLGAEVHCEGEIYGQAAWDLALALTAKHGHHTGWRTSERIFFTALPDSGSYLPEGSFPVYDAYLNADDDDGNLVNGTPNAKEIFDAFDLHEIAGTQVPSSAACFRPDQPVVSVTPDCDAFDLSWGAVPGVDRYEVLRGEVRVDSAFFPVATVPSSETSFRDADVAPATDYWYAVLAVATDGCESAVESPVAARLVTQPIVSVRGVVSDDVPRGNRSGFADPGEEVDLIVTLENFGEVDALAVTGKLASATPGVTILESADTWPDVVVGGSSTNTGPLRFVTDAGQLACGDSIRFEIVPDESTGCSGESSRFDLTLGDQDVVQSDDFESDTGWAWDPTSSTAATGHWVRGDPDPTDFQPGDDVTPDPGSLCWFTAPNQGGVGTDDVDDGVTVLVSPTIDLTGEENAVLSYYRWFANRDLGEDSGDFFTADVSDDDGSSWVNLETLGTNDTAATWTRKEYRLEDFIALTSSVRIRFRASDGPATGNLIEAAVDEVRIDRPICDDTPACFTEPTFAGADNAVPGDSCGETSISWHAASSNCENATISYSVYRSTDPGFVPDPSSLVATGLTGTSFTDSLLDPSEAYTYVVRADDSRAGQDANLNRVTAAPAAAPDQKPPIFDGLAGAGTGSACGETTLSWTAGLESCSTPVSYEVYRSTDPAFVPSPATLVASTLSLGYTDAALVPGTGYTYVVRARDALGNEDDNLARLTVGATALDLVLVDEDFESGAGGFTVVEPNDATAGNWEWGDPESTPYQSGDDHTPDPGVNAWVTGLSPSPGNGDVDDGTTTLLSPRYDLSTAVDPVLGYARWFNNDLGAAPGEDPMDIEISSDDGQNWVTLEQVGANQPFSWVEVEFALAGLTSLTTDMRVRFTARDLNAGSLVEAGVDDLTLVDRGQGCGGCSTPVGTVGTLLVATSGDDVVLDWTADPVSATRYAVYRLSGPTFDDAVRIGTTDTRTFVHEGAMTSGDAFSYRVSAVDECGNESALE